MFSPIRTIRPATTIVLIAALVGCDEPLSSGPDGLPDAPAEIVIGGRTITQRSVLWRDFMPLAPPGGQPLAAVVIAVTGDGSEFPEGVIVERLWVGLGEGVWSSDVEAAAVAAPSELRAVARDGPLWGPGVRVTTVVRLTRGAESWLLRADDQPIERTD